MARFLDKVGVIASKGFFQEVANPANPASRSQASVYSAIHAIYLPIAFGSASSMTISVPANAMILDAVVSVGTAFNGTTPTIKVGSAAGAADEIPSTSLASAGSTVVGGAAPLNVVISTTVYVTYTSGGSSAGAGQLVVRYMVNPLNQTEYSADFPI